MICCDCGAAESGKNSVVFCDACVQARRDHLTEVRAEEAKLEPMSWDLWVRWLSFYGLNAGLDMAWCLMAYEKWGCEMPYSACISDYPELDHAFCSHVVKLTFNGDEEVGHPAVNSREGTEVIDFVREDKKLGLLAPTPTVPGPYVPICHRKGN